MAGTRFLMQHTEKSFSVRVPGWHSPRMVALVDMFVYFQASTCFPCGVCNQRVEEVKTNLETGNHPRSGLWDEEVVLDEDTPSTYDLVQTNGMAFFVLPYVGSDDAVSIASFLSRMVKFGITIAGDYGKPMQLPIVYKVYDVKSKPASQIKLLDGIEQLQRRLLAIVNNGLVRNQAKNMYLLIAALVVHEMNVEKAHNSLTEFAKSYPPQKIRINKFCGIGGWKAREIGQTLRGHYYNCETALYLLDSTDVPGILAARVKKAYDDSIFSPLLDDLHLGRSYSTTTYYQLLKALESSDTASIDISALKLPLEVHDALSYAPYSLASDAEKAAWLYSLRYPEVHRILNRALFDDNREALDPWMPMIMLIKHYANCNSKKECLTTYRGSRITDVQFNALRVNSVYRDPKFVSTSTREDIADRFMALYGGDYKCVFTVRGSISNAVALDVSYYKDEEEVLLTPYSPLFVTSKDKQKKLVHFTVLGDEEAKEHLEKHSNIVITEAFIHLRLLQNFVLWKFDYPMLHFAQLLFHILHIRRCCKRRNLFAGTSGTSGSSAGTSAGTSAGSSAGPSARTGRWADLASTSSRIPPSMGSNHLLKFWSGLLISLRNFEYPIQNNSPPSTIVMISPMAFCCPRHSMNNLSLWP